MEEAYEQECDGLHERRTYVLTTKGLRVNPNCSNNVGAVTHPIQDEEEALGDGGGLRRCIRKLRKVLKVPCAPK